MYFTPSADLFSLKLLFRLFSTITYNHRKLRYRYTADFQSLQSLNYIFYFKTTLFMTAVTFIVTHLFHNLHLQEKVVLRELQQLNASTA